MFRAAAVRAVAPSFPELLKFPLSWPFLSLGLLDRLQAFRDALGVPVVLSSPADGGLFRLGDDGQHGAGRAVDIRWPVGVEKSAAYDVARQIFSGVGVYPWGMHLDVRPDRQPGNPASWGRVYYPDGTYADVAALTVLHSLEGAA